MRPRGHTAKGRAVLAHGSWGRSTVLASLGPGCVRAIRPFAKFPQKSRKCFSKKIVRQALRSRLPRSGDRPRSAPDRNGSGSGGTRAAARSYRIKT